MGTYTFALLEVSDEAFDEVAVKLKEAGYGHAFDEVDGRPVIDMRGIALVCRADREQPDPPTSQPWGLPS